MTHGIALTGVCALTGECTECFWSTSSDHCMPTSTVAEPWLRGMSLSCAVRHSQPKPGHYLHNTYLDFAFSYNFSTSAYSFAASASSVSLIVSSLSRYLSPSWTVALRPSKILFFASNSARKALSGLPGAAVLARAGICCAALEISTKQKKGGNPPAKGR